MKRQCLRKTWMRRLWQVFVTTTVLLRLAQVDSTSRNRDGYARMHYDEAWTAGCLLKYLGRKDEDAESSHTQAEALLVFCIFQTRLNIVPYITILFIDIWFDDLFYYFLFSFLNRFQVFSLIHLLILHAASWFSIWSFHDVACLARKLFLQTCQQKLTSRRTALWKQKHVEQPWHLSFDSWKEV